MTELLGALAAGLMAGLFFSFIKLPIPAPPALSGVIGIVGVYLGHCLYQEIIKFLSNNPL